VRPEPIKKHSKTGAKEERIMRLLKEVVAQEYSAQYGCEKRKYMGMDLDHIHGRHATGFHLPAMFSPLNLQLINRVQHEEKTNSPTKEGQRQDYREMPIQGRMRALNDRLCRKLGPVWNLADLKRVVESEIVSQD
jgi:hypothetical protein